MEDTLSLHLATTLAQRAPTDVLFELASVEDGQVKLRTVTTSQWLCFATSFLSRVREASPPPSCVQTQSSSLAPPTSSPPQPSSRCDVAIVCRETFHACLLESACLCGAKTFCILNPDDPPRRLETLRGTLNPAVQMADADVSDMLTEAVASAAATQVGNAPPWDASVQALVAPCPDSSVAYFMHTSGSTGTPKCVVGLRGNLRAYACGFAREADGGLGCTSASCHFLTLSTPFFDPSLGDTVCTLLSGQGRQRIASRACLVDGDVSGLLFAQPPPTHIVSTPALWGTVSPSVAVNRVLPATTKLFLGGEKLPQRLVDVWAEAVELHNIYGVTEATVYQSAKRVQPGSCAERVTCGRGAGQNSIDIRTPLRHANDDAADDDEQGTDGMDGVGEVVLSGPQVCLGYRADLVAYGRPTYPFRAVPEGGGNDREYWTGDLARWVSGDHTERELLIVGRRDRQVKVNGQRTSLEEVEATMARVLDKAVMECCCGACVDAENGKVTITAACVVTMAATDGDAEDVVCFDDHASAVQRAFQELLRQHLPAHAVPSAWLLLPSSSPARLPRTATGKLDRRQAAELTQRVRTPCGAAEREETHDADGVPPALQSLFGTVRDVWKAELGVPVRARTNFFLVGGDSLGALKLCRAIFMALDGRDDLIDDCGGLPAAFRPHVLVQHPRLLDYVGALDARLRNTETCVTPDGGPAPPRRPKASRHVPTPEAEAAEAAAAAAVSVTASSSGDAEALLSAAILGNIALAEALITHEVSAVNGLYSRATPCITPLHIAARRGDVGMVDMLLRHGAKVTAVSPDGVTPLHIAAGTPSLTVLERLVQAPGAAVLSRDGRQQSLLHVAARHGRAETVRYLLTVHGLDVAVRDKWQRSAAHWAVLHGHVNVLRAMVAVARVAQTERSDGSRKRGRGAGTNRFVRLAQKRTTLAYETLPELAARVAPHDAEMHELCSELAKTIEQ